MRNIRMFGFLTLAGLLPLCAGANGPMCTAKSQAAWSGTVTAVNTDTHTIKAASWWQTRTFDVSSACAISTLDKGTAALNDLRPGEKVKVCYQKQGGLRIADRIEVQSLHLTGTVLTVDEKDRMATVQENLQHRTFRVADDCKVILSHNREGTLADLAPGARVSVTYDSPGAPLMAYRIQEQSQTTASIR
jgi:hypothetical protein